VEEATGNTRRIFCNFCKQVTHHNLVLSHAYDYRIDEESPDEYGQYRLWACAGCDTCTMEDHYTADYMTSQVDEEEFVQEYSSVYYPKRAVGFRPAKRFNNLPSELSGLYGEVVSAYNDKLVLLCSGGLRALVEGICADKKIKGRDLETKIDGMSAVLPTDIVKNLHGFRFIGNDALHDLVAPNEFELNLAFDVIEDILNFLYALNYKTSLLDRLKGRQSRSGGETVTDKSST
jgi:hypothetical protein